MADGGGAGGRWPGSRARHKHGPRALTRMRVALVSANFAPHVGGVERFTETLAAGLAERGHDVSVLCCRADGAPKRETRDGYVVERIPSTYVLDRRLNVPYPVPDPLRLASGLGRATAQADVVHVQDVLYATSLPTLLLARHRGIASVLTQHVGFVPQRSTPLDGLQRGALATVGRCARLATIVATYNRSVAEWVEGRWGIPNVRVLPVGVATSTGADPGRRTLRRSFGLPEDRFVALFVGRDVPKKGLDVFFGAADPAYQLLAVTDRNRAEPGVLILPFMSSDRLQELMHCVDAFVLPSEAEGFPLSVQEALASGLPLVTTLQPGYDDYLGPDDAIFVDRNSRSLRLALSQLVEDGSLTARLSERARAVAERHFGIGPFVAAYEEIYAEAIGTRSASSPP
jgi:D-inositol-3-phosphate glycosyltransferase